MAKTTETTLTVETSDKAATPPTSPDSGTEGTVDPTIDPAGAAAALDALAKAKVDADSKAADAPPAAPPAEVVLTPAQIALAAAKAAADAALAAVRDAEESVFLESTQSAYDTWNATHTPLVAKRDEVLARYDSLYLLHMQDVAAELVDAEKAVTDSESGNPRLKPVVPATAPKKGKNQGPNGGGGTADNSPRDAVYEAYLTAAQADKVANHPKFTAAGKTADGRTIFTFPLHSQPTDLNYYAKKLLKAALDTTWSETVIFRERATV